MASSSQSTELLKEAKNWNLSGDSKLLEFMQSISKTLENRCTTTTKNINGMLLKLDETNIALSNTTNKLLALQHSQFVENRVYEEEENESIANISEVPTNEKKLPSTSLTSMESIQLAIDNGIKMMNKCYEKVSLDLDDSDNDFDDDDDENGNINIAFRPKDPYLSKPIPFIIGSKDWKEKWHIGIIESDIESDDNDEEQFSESSDDPSLSVSLPSNAATMSGSESGSVWGLHPSSIQPQKEMYKHSSDDDLSSNKSVSIHSKSENTISDNILEKKIAIKVPVLPRNIIADNKTTSTSRNAIKDGLFSDMPPPPDHHHQSFIKKQQEKGLFDDSDSENDNDIINSVKQHKPLTNSSSSFFREQQSQRKSVNLFSDEPPEFDDPPPVESQRKPPLNLFADSDDDDNIFSANNTTTIKRTNLFDEEPPAILSTKNLHDTKKSLENNNINKNTVKRDLFDDDSNDEDDNDFNVTLSKNTNKIEPEVLKTNIIKPKITNLFDDDDEPDFFDSLIKSKVEQKSVNTKLEGKLDTKVTTTKKLDNLFNTERDNDDFDIFTKNMESISKTITTTHETKMSKPTQIQLPQPGKKINLFDDEPLEEDPFENIIKTKPEIKSRNKFLTIQKPKGLFDDSDVDDGDDQLFGTGSSDKIGVEEKTLVNGKDKPRQEIFKVPEILKEKSLILTGSNHDVIEKTEIKKTIYEFNTKKTTFGNDDDAETNDIFKNVSSSQPLPKNVNINVDGLLPGAKPPSFHKDPTIDKTTHDSNYVNKFETENKMITQKQLIDHVENFITNKSDQINKVEENVRGEILSVDISDDKKIHTNDDKFETTQEIDEPPQVTEKPKVVSLFWDTPTETDTDDWLVNAGDFKNKNIFDKFNDQISHNNNNNNNTNFINDKGEYVEKENKNKSALNYNPIGLFDDLPPPDDDNIIFSTPQKKTTQIYYDDTESFLTTNLSGLKSSSMYVMDDEPPVDNIFEDITPDHEEINDLNKKKSNYETISSRGKDEIDDVKIQEKFDTIKNDGKIEIKNRISSVADLIEARNRNTNDDNLPESPKKLSPPKKLNTNVNINVGALLPGARPPQLQRKETKSVTITTEDLNSPQLTQSNRDEILFDKTQKNTLSSIQTSVSDPNILTSLNKNRVKIPIKRRPSTRKGRREIYSKSLLMEDAGEQIPDQTSGDITPIQSDTKGLKSNVDISLSKALFGDEDDHDVDFVGATINSLSHKSQQIKPNNIIKQKIEPEKPPSEPKLEQKLNIKGSIFSDDGEDDDDLFAKTIPTKKTMPVKDISSKKTTLKEKKQKSHEIKTSKSNNLFSSDEDQSIFSITKNKAPLTKTESKTKIPVTSSTSIFPSDDEDDSLFGGSSKSITTTTRKSFSFIKSTGSDKLFGDIDDDMDDDIFNTKSKVSVVPPKKTASAKNEKQNSKRSTVTKSANNDDPLGDLI